ncbi:hypothetical protein F5883DRAFT_543128 [Diaporthe sp. PMI_573]|nr:hypothetical protein F5883DRAFT_543128 [Diaporthaceae sp. PMI_573]
MRSILSVCWSTWVAGRRRRLSTIGQCRIWAGPWTGKEAPVLTLHCTGRGRDMDQCTSIVEGRPHGGKDATRHVGGKKKPSLTDVFWHHVCRRGADSAA